MGHEVSLGRSQVTRVAAECRLAIADSAFNEEELIDVGFAHTAVAPLLIDMTAAAPTPIRCCRAGWPRPRPTAAPTSCSSARCRRTRPSTTSSRCWRCTAASTTTAPGSISSAPRSARPTGRPLSAFIAELGLSEAVSITGSVSPQELESYYRAADVFVCASEHEGFCVPLVEAMGHGLPVVAYSTSAVPETVADAGLLLSSKEPLLFAASVHRVVEDDRLRRQFVEAGTRRAEDVLALEFPPALRRPRRRRAGIDAVTEAGRQS